MIKYVSTRGGFETDSLNAVLSGLAPNGGLFVPENIEELGFDWKACLAKDFYKMAEIVIGHLLPEFDNVKCLVEDAYNTRFASDEVTPLVKIKDSFVLELFHGPTSAFKDVALCMLPRLITQAKKQTGLNKEIVILTATSGDTGKAALEGFKDVNGTKILVFYPNEGVSEVQKLQMVSQEGKNVRVCAVRGNFDDCQTAVKKAFAELKGKTEEKGVVLSSANSINIGRLVPQVVYYFKAYSDLVKRNEISLGDKVDFVVPTGNFGDILAGFYAKLMGLPVGKLVCASNENNVLFDFINTGVYDKNRPFYKTQSPSMDILISSNLERLLYIACGKDSSKVSSWMSNLFSTGRFEVDKKTLDYIQDSFDSCYADQNQVSASIKECRENDNYLCDPHTAVAYFACKKHLKETENKTVILSTASPYKFPNSVLKSLGFEVCDDEFDSMVKLNEVSNVFIPNNLAGLKTKKPRFFDVIDSNSIVDYVKEFLWK